MAGWLVIGFFLAAMLGGVFIPNGRLKLVGSACFTILPPALVALAYHRASQTGCSGGDCTGAMMGIMLLGFGACVVSLIAGGIFFQGALSALFKKLSGTYGERRIPRIFFGFLPFLCVVMAAGGLYTLTLRPPDPMPSRCDGRMITVRIGEGYFRFPVASEIEIWPNNRLDTPLPLSDRSVALRLCAQAAKAEISLAQLRFSSPHASFAPRDGAWMTRYFGAPLPAGPGSLCDRPNLNEADQPFCPGKDAPRLALVPSLPDISVTLRPHGSPLKLSIPPRTLTEIEVAHLGSALPDLRKSYNVRSRVGGFEVDRKGPHRLILRTSVGSRQVTDIATCNVVSQKALQCHGMTLLPGEAEARYMLFLPLDASDAKIISTVSRALLFVGNLGPGTPTG
jgi:hypothetical protein